MLQSATWLKAVFALVFFAATTAGAAGKEQESVPAPFRDSAPHKTVKVEFPYWDYILSATVFEAGRSDRRAGRMTFTWEKSRAQWGNRKKTALEGNRVYFQAYDEQNFAALVQVRERLEGLPGKDPMATWTRNQQLAYWLNLYNVAMVEQLVRAYPLRQLENPLYGEDGLLDKKILNVAGVSLSLNDIHHRILIPKWHDPIIMYGLFHGYVGSPNLRQEAYTDENVYDLLADNAAEFVNSIRGATVKDNTLRVSELYRVNAALFPNFDEDVRAEVLSHLDFSYAALAQGASKVEADRSDYYIADLNLGVAVDRNMGRNLGREVEGYESRPGYGHVKVPAHVLAYVAKIQKKKARQKPNVTIEEVAEPRKSEGKSEGEAEAKGDAEK